MGGYPSTAASSFNKSFTNFFVAVSRTPGALWFESVQTDGGTLVTAVVVEALSFDESATETGTLLGCFLRRWLV